MALTIDQLNDLVSQNLTTNSSADSVVNGAQSSSNKKLDSVNAKINELLADAGPAEIAYIQKSIQDRDGYDIAFGSLNPDAKKKAQQYQKLLQQKLEIENETVNIESARDIMNQAYENQINAINTGSNSLAAATDAKRITNDAGAMGAAGALGANATSLNSISALSNLQNAQEQGQIEASRQNALQSAYAGQAAIPSTVASIAATNKTIEAQDHQNALTDAQIANLNKPSTTSGKNSTSKFGDPVMYKMINGKYYAFDKDSNMREATSKEAGEWADKQKPEYGPYKDAVLTKGGLRKPAIQTVSF